jgi:hydrophobic/amphiphilic exporter-1 (mainly G- bacteria), HAE1 family
MVVGMSPIAFSLSSGSEFKSGLAWALIGGLVSSLLLTLVLVPVVYSKVDQWRVAVINLWSPLIAGKAKHVAGKSAPVRNPVEREAPPLSVGT